MDRRTVLSLSEFNKHRSISIARRKHSPQSKATGGSFRIVKIVSPRKHTNLYRVCTQYSVPQIFHCCHIRDHLYIWYTMNVLPLWIFTLLSRPFYSPFYSPIFLLLIRRCVFDSPDPTMSVSISQWGILIAHNIVKHQRALPNREPHRRWAIDYEA